MNARSSASIGREQPALASGARSRRHPCLVRFLATTASIGTDVNLAVSTAGCAGCILCPRQDLLEGVGASLILKRACVLYRTASVSGGLTRLRRTRAWEERKGRSGAIAWMERGSGV